MTGAARLSPGRARRLAWGLAALAIALMIGGYGAYAMTDAFELSVGGLVGSAVAPAFALVGALVASRHPRNAIGWILLGGALATGIANVAEGFVEHRLADDHDPDALVGVAVAYLSVSWIPTSPIPATFLLLLFPDGRLPSRRWRPVAWCAGAAILGLLVTVATVPERSDDYPTVRNPFAVDSPVMELLALASQLLVFAVILCSAASVVARFRRAGRVQRQQIKWLATAGAVLAVAAPLDVVLADALGGAAFVGSTLAAIGLPAAIGIAILRHRLYDIDVVINRALVYGALTATLAAAYLGAVLLLQIALSPLTASSNLAIAVSTLAVAALFQPARRRIQAIVDRRFYRQKYDAARTLEHFGARLRDEVSLTALTDDLRAVVADTMQPAHVTLWLRTPEAGR